MKNFAQLFRCLDETTKTNEKISFLVEYFEASKPEDAVWAVSFLIGRKPRQIVPAKKLRVWSAELANIPDWLFEESYYSVGDLAETITLLLPQSNVSTDIPLHKWVEDKLLPIRDKNDAEQKEEIISAWQPMNNDERFVWNKLITGGFRVGVSSKLVERAIAKFSGINEAVIAHRLMGKWSPTKNFYKELISEETGDANISRPYPFYLAYQLDDNIESLGDIKDWQAEWKYDGIRSQLIKRKGEVFLWSRGEELINEKFPELVELGFKLPKGTVIDGEILSWNENEPMPFGELQKRIGRKNVTKKILEEIPAVIVAYDLIEFEEKDIREYPLGERHKKLRELITKISDKKLILTEVVKKNSWDELRSEREKSRSRKVEGLMLKKLESTYKVGRKRGDWWKWKVDPLSVDAVLIYAQRGHGRRATLYTDYTFGIWDGDMLVPFAKAYSGLTDIEIRKVDNFVKKNTLEKFGPVRTVKAELVFEIAFEGIQYSTRHKSGVAVRFPRILRWRNDKKIEEADTLESVKSLIPS